MDDRFRMTNYSDSPSMVRVDFFKTPGKWHMTEAWDMKEYRHFPIDPTDAVKVMFEATKRGRSLLMQYIIVVLEPYHENAYYPIMLVPQYAQAVILKAREENDKGNYTLPPIK